MEDTSIKAITLAVGIFVTIVIVSLVVASFNEIKTVYKLTKNTEISIHSKFDNIYLTYDGKEVNGMGLLNIIRKFEDDEEIFEGIIYPARDEVKLNSNANHMRESEQLRIYLADNDLVSGVRFRFENKYRVEVKEVDLKTVIEFIAT